MNIFRIIDYNVNCRKYFLIIIYKRLEQHTSADQKVPGISLYTLILNS